MENEPIVESVPTQNGQEEVAESKVEKPQLTPEQQRGINERNFTRLAKELGYDIAKLREPEKETKTKTDYAKLAFLAGEGIPQEDREWLLDESKTTGKELVDLVGYNYVKEELKRRKDARNVANALPSETKRSGTQQGETVDYWLAKLDREKLTVLDIPDIKMRRAVVNAKRASAKDTRKFAPNPLV